MRCCIRRNLLLSGLQERVVDCFDYLNFPGGETNPTPAHEGVYILPADWIGTSEARANTTSQSVIDLPEIGHFPWESWHRQLGLKFRDLDRIILSPSLFESALKTFPPRAAAVVGSQVKMALGKPD